MDQEEASYSADMMADLDGNGTFDSNDLPFENALNSDPLFGNGFGEGMAPSPFQFSTPGMPSWVMDSPGRFGAPRTDSSATAIMTKHESSMKPRSNQSSTSPESSSESPASSQSSSRRKRKSPTSQDTSNTKNTSPSRREGPPSLSPQHGVKKVAGTGGKHIGHDSGYSMSSGLTPDAIAHEHDMSQINTAFAPGSSLFDFDSAASSPGAFHHNIMNTSAFDALSNTPRTTIAPQTLTMTTPADRKQATFFFNSRENSPLDTMGPSQHASPAALFTNDSPAAMNGMAMDGTLWQSSSRAPAWNNDFTTGAGLSPSPVADTLGSPMTTVSSNMNHPPFQLSIRPFNNKSRVETQIPVMLTMTPFPQGVTKVHLQSQTISKPKLLAKDPAKMSDTLELHATVVCTSAMQKPGLKERALRRAAGLPEIPVKREGRRSSTGDMEDEDGDPDDPLNGGDVKICKNCVNRERKRAARKKAKKQEDEDHWSQFEQERIVVFNTSEYKDWTPCVPKDGSYNDAYPDHAKQVEIPMRIACYCRHQGEKVGFQVIFTIKDHQDRVLAQNISDSILITDDHKTQAPITGANGLPADVGYSIGGNVPMFNPDLQQSAFQHRPYHSTNDLQALRANFQPQGFSGLGASQNAGMMASQSTSVTPRNLSRPASPTAHAGPNKKRKGSSVHHRIPPSLAMTRVSGGQQISIPPATSLGSAGVGPMSAGPIMTGSDQAFGGVNLNMNPYQSNPPTPNSNAGFVTPLHRNTSAENMQLYQFYSAPNSAHPSRVPSPIPNTRPPTRGFQTQAVQGQMPDMINQAASGMSFSPETAPAIQRSVVTRVNPAEGPMTGGIQIDIHGHDFYQGVQVKFGDQVAATTFWNEGALIAVLPPSNMPGPVEVALIHPNETSSFFRPPQRAQYFKYVDDREQQTFEIFGRAVAAKQFGTSDVSHIASYLASHGHQVPYRPALNTSGFQQYSQQQPSMLAMANHTRKIEEDLLEVLNAIDLDDSPYAPNYDIKLKNGASMLSLASSLGLTRLVAGLVARGATVDIRDKGGFTPLMVASMMGHMHIVRLLTRKGADPNMRNKLGFTAIELTKSLEVEQELQNIPRHFRAKSLGNSPVFRSRTNSVVFGDTTVNLVHPSPAHSSCVSLVTDSEDDSQALEVDAEEDDVLALAEGHVQSRRGSVQIISALSSRRPSVSVSVEPEQSLMMTSPIAAMAAWREQLSAQINHFQQSVAELQNRMPNIPDVQMVRRFSSIMPAIPRADSFFAASTPPPPYEEKDPGKAEDAAANEKKVGLMSALAESVLDDTCERRFGSVTCASSRPKSKLTTIVDKDIRVCLGKKGITKEQQMQLRLAHQARLKKGTSDWKMWVIWLPILICIVALMVRNALPQIKTGVVVLGRIVPGIATRQTVVTEV